MRLGHVALSAGVLASALSTDGCARAAATATDRPAIAIEAVVAAPSDIVEGIDVVGTLAPKHAARLKSEYSGIVAHVHVAEWVPVRRGQPLAVLDTREATALLDAANANALQAEVAEARAVRELHRAERLKDVGLITAQGLEEMRTARDAASATLAAARAQRRAAETRLEKNVVRAPFDGVVSFRGIDVGDRVESMGSGDPMFEVVDPTRLELTMTVPSGQLGLVRVGQTVRFAVEGDPGAVSTGRVTYINPSVDPQSRSGRVVADVPNPNGGLRGGLFVTCRIHVGARSAVQLPRAALREWDLTTGKACVFVVEGDTVWRRDVRTGAAGGDLVEIAHGLSAGEQIATRGAYMLKAGDRVRLVAPPPGS
jgi:membrane fusion protein, multidrug efflux system